MAETKKKTSVALIVVLVILGTIILLGVVSCLACSKCASDVAEEIESEPRTSEEAKTYKIGEVAKAGDIEWKVLSAKKQNTLKDPSGFDEPKKANGVYVVIELQVKNTGDEAKTADSSAVAIVDDQDRKFSADTDVTFYIPTGKDLFLEQLNPNVAKKRMVIFDLDKKAKGLKFRAGDLDITGDAEILVDLGL